MHVGEATSIGVKRGNFRFAPGAVLRSAMNAPGLALWHKAQILDAVDRQIGEGVVDHQMVDALVRDAGSAKAVGPATRNAREEVNSCIWLTIGVSTLSPVPSK